MCAFRHVNYCEVAVSLGVVVQAVMVKFSLREGFAVVSVNGICG